jgi:hypothetical protein
LKDDKDNFINKSNIVDKEIQSFSGKKFFIPKAHFHQFTSYSHQIEELQKTSIKNFLKTSKKENIDSETIFGNFFKEHLKEFHNLVNKIKAALKLTLDHLNAADFNDGTGGLSFLPTFFSAVKNFYFFDKLNPIDKAIFLKNQYNLEAKNTKLPLGKVIDHALLHIVDPDNTPFAIIPSKVVNFSNKASDHEGILIKKLSIYNAE